MKKIGIYQIVNVKNNKRYIGGTSKFYNRINQHKWSLRNNRHHSKYLQNDWNNFGENSFKFEILITCHKKMLLWYEQQFIDALKPEYNIIMNAGSMLGYHHTEETKLLLSNMKTGVPSNRIYTVEEKIKLAKRSYDNEFSAKEYNGFLSPSGNVVNIFNLNKFCRENNLDCGHMCAVYSGERKSHKKWTLAKERLGF